MDKFNKLYVKWGFEKASYIDNFKSEVKTYIKTNDNIPLSEKSDLLKFIYDFGTLEINKQDFVKRKRSKSVVPFYSRCIAKKSSGEQCTRKKRCDSSYCGTHDKNRPHGEINECDKEENILKKVEIWIQEINGIVYYIDGKNKSPAMPTSNSNKVSPSGLENWPKNGKLP